MSILYVAPKKLRNRRILSNKTGMKKLSVVLAEDHETVRKGIKLLINEQSDMEVVGEANNGDEIIELVQKLNPDIVVMDISMPQTNGLRASKKLKRNFPDIKVLMLTRHKDNGYVQQLIQAGVSGYVLKQSAPSELLNAIRVVGAGNSYLDSTITQTVMVGYARQTGSLHGEGNPEITDREEEVLRLTARGYSNKKIAERLSISVKTVDSHKANAMRKIGLKDRVDVVDYAIFNGWMEDN